MPAEKLALITGANKGIGLEMARQLAGQGTTILLGARDQARGEAAAGSLAAQGWPVTALRIDVTDGVSVSAAPERSGRSTAAWTSWSTTPGSAAASGELPARSPWRSCRRSMPPTCSGWWP
jgi:NAD(P)-dependent dehydrogenase (short-subunit alcohol dehydrogenase family)